MRARTGIAILAAALLGAAAFAQETTPTAIDLMKQARAARTKLGPATLVTTFAGPFDGQPGQVVTTIKRNDDRHFTASSAGEMGTVHLDDGTWRWYANGDKKVFYDAVNNVYYKDFSAAPFPPDFMGDLLADADFSNPKGADFRKATVTAVMYEGQPAWEIAVTDIPGTADAGSGTVTITRADSLMRHIILKQGSTTYDITCTYTPASEPFPASTIAFTPPSGAKLVTPKAAPAKPAPAKPAPAKPAPKKPAAKMPAKKAPAKRPKK